MKRGRRTTEFWLVSLWSLKAFVAVAALLAFRPASLWLALFSAVPVSLLVWQAGTIADNYAGGRFQLKAQRAALKHGQAPEDINPEDANPGRTFLFGSHVDEETEEEEEEEDE